MKPELKPCPFCGGKASLHHEGRAYCKNCGIENMFLLVDKWNSRPIEDDLQQKIDEMKPYAETYSEIIGMTSAIMRLGRAPATDA